MLRTLILAAALAAPLAQAALAGQTEQQASANQVAVASFDGNPYAAPQPTVGD